jgi:hypothetical protein
MVKLMPAIAAKLVEAVGLGGDLVLAAPMPRCPSIRSASRSAGHCVATRRAQSSCATSRAPQQIS